jgi:hypothetical protein
MVFSGRKKLRKNQFDFETLAWPPQLAGIVPQIRFLGHGEHLKTFCILDEPVTYRINWPYRIGVKSM